jgi:hypothetical protein
VTTVVIPWRGGCEWRERSLAYVGDWYATHHPGWRVIVADVGNTGPWCKATAVAAGLTRTDDRVIVVADADVITPAVGDCVAEVESGRSPWAVPHHAVYRLNADATRRVWDGDPLPDWRAPHSRLRSRVREIHRAVTGGGVVVLDRACWDTAPIDARFRGWGQEDLAWGWALTRVHGQPYRRHGPCLHLWHPVQARLSRTTGTQDGQALWRRYSRAYTAAEVGALLAEPGAHPGPPTIVDMANDGKTPAERKASEARNSSAKDDRTRSAAIGKMQAAKTAGNRVEASLERVKLDETLTRQRIQGQ